MRLKSVINMFMFTFLIVLSISVNVQCANILGVFSIASVSHQVVFQPIWKELSLRGHNVTIMSPNPLRDPSLVNLTEIDLSFMYRNFDEIGPMMSQSMDHWTIMSIMVDFGEKNLEDLLQHHEVMELVKDNSTQFDVVLAEILIPAVYAFAAKYKCPLIGVASLSAPLMGHERAGTPNHPILYPEFTTTFTEDMTFLEKIDAVIYYFWQQYVYHIQMYPMFNRIAKKYFGEDIPNIEDIERNMSMLFLNTNPILHGARPHGPNVIHMGRMHLKPKQPLPTDLKTFLDTSTKGVIYFSLGTNVKSKLIDKDKRDQIMEVFSELPYNILWKFEDTNLKGKPSNVKISKWLPQQDLLGHPNIKLFITQGGLQSLEEAIDNGVPLLAIPFIADQYGNAARIEKLGIGLQIPYYRFTKDSFNTSILRILQEPRFKERVLEIRALLQDQPTSGLERAVWWTEYVIRNKGAPYFRNRVVDMSWHHFLLLDVFAVLFIALFVVIYVVFTLLKFVVSLYSLSQKPKVKIL